MGRLAALIQSGQVVFAGGAVSVTGDAIDPQAISEAQDLLRDQRPAGTSAGSVNLTATPLSPYRVSLRRTPEAITVSGHLPDAETRRRVLAALRQRVFREPVIDRTRLAEGAPPGLVTALDTGAGLLSTLVTGEVAVSDSNLILSGETLYREAAIRAPERIATALPAGWTGQATVKPREAAARRDQDSCRQGVEAATAAADLRFSPGSTSLTPAFYPALDALAALAKSCPALRLTVSGPADPPGAKPAPSAEDEALRAEAAKANPVKADAKKAEAKRPDGKKPDGKKDEARKDEAKKDEAKKGEPKKPEPKPSDTPPAPGKPAEDEASGLARQRAQALVEYLLQAGLRPGQVAAGPDRGAGPAVVALAPAETPRP
jgi:outer membrane protein OmpA-like peptidoglycan-associated protein